MTTLRLARGVLVNSILRFVKCQNVVGKIVRAYADEKTSAVVDIYIDAALWKMGVVQKEAARLHALGFFVRSKAVWRSDHPWSRWEPAPSGWQRLVSISWARRCRRHTDGGCAESVSIAIACAAYTKGQLLEGKRC